MLDRDFGTVRVRGRVLGCILGALAGLAALLLQGGIFCFSRLLTDGGPQSYIGRQSAVAFITASPTADRPPS